MKPVEGEEAQAVLDAVAAGEPIPNGYAFDGTTVYVMDEADEERIEAGGPVVPPETDDDAIVEGEPLTGDSETPKGSPSNPVVGDPV